MSDFKAKMHQIVCRLGLRLRPRWGSLQCSPRPPSWILGGLLLRGMGREGRAGKGRGGKGERRDGEGEGSLPPPIFLAPALRQVRSDGGYIGIYTPKISPPKTYMGYFSSSYEAEHQQATAS